MAQSRLAGRALALAIGGAIGHDPTQRLARPAEGGHRDVRRQGKAQASPRSREQRIAAKAEQFDYESRHVKR
jgi:hypothetical protein